MKNQEAKGKMQDYKSKIKMVTDSTRQAAVLLVLVLSAASVSSAKYSGGTGEPNEPYRIATPNDLNDVGNHVEDFNKCFVLVNDINLADYTGTQFNIIGDLHNPFAGVFDGNGHTISNFTYDGAAAEVGLFARVEYLGQGAPLIKDLTLTEPNVDAPSGYCAAALCGRLDGGAAEAIIRGCKVVGGRISGGGDCSAGGLVGYNSGGIEKCCSTATVRGGYHVGGLVGLNNVFKGTSLITESYSAASVWGPAHSTGGMAGYNGGTIENSYSWGQVAIDPNAGVLVGYSDEFASYVKCFWDSDVNPGVNGIGNTTDPNVIGKTTTEMMMESTFTDGGWDFVWTWAICEGTNYPRLFWEIPAGDFLCPDGVSLIDFGYLAARWGDVCCSCDHCQGADLDLSGVVDWPDMKIFRDHWLEEE
ncbi:MAG: hypothetical protein ACYTBJ_12470 [Planctomycetota bacterium]|jgi:hypothetical protein